MQFHAIQVDGAMSLTVTQQGDKMVVEELKVVASTTLETADPLIAIRHHLRTRRKLSRTVDIIERKQVTPA